MRIRSLAKTAARSTVPTKTRNQDPSIQGIKNTALATNPNVTDPNTTPSIEPKPPVISTKTKKPIEVSSIDPDPNEPKVDKILSRIKSYKGNLVIGANIGKNKITPNHKAADDYISCFNKLSGYVDYLSLIHI